MDAFLKYLEAKDMSVWVEVALAAGAPRMFNMFEEFVHEDPHAFLMVTARGEPRSFTPRVILLGLRWWGQLQLGSRGVGECQRARLPSTVQG